MQNYLGPQGAKVSQVQGKTLKIYEMKDQNFFRISSILED